MSVSHRKINGLIEDIVKNTKELKINDENATLDKDVFIDLCKSIYLLESSTDSMSRSEILTKISTDIRWYASRIIEG